MEFGFVIFLLSSALFGHSSGFTTQSTTTESSLTAGGAPCGGTLTQSRGEFFSPNYPNNYPNNAHCTWSLLAGELQVVSLNFTFVDLEPGWDFISVYNGPTAQHSLLGTVSRNQRATFNSSSRYMTVVFSSDVSVTPQGFRAEWAFIDYISCRDHCGYNGTLCSCTSSCQSYGNCCNDYYDYCFPTTTTTTTTTTRTTRESTMTASSLTAGGAPCGGNLTQSRGEFFSPNYPNNYPNNAHCTWSLLAGELQVVSLNFTFVDLESCCDFIRVYNGPTAQHSLLGSVIGNQRATFNSSSRYMTVVFSSDVSVTPQGFRAEWAFIDYISCRDHCGYNGTLCSCTSSCQSYGNCCNDYYDYCFPTTTTTTTTTTRTTRESTMTASSLTAGGAPCGGNLTQSRGEFFSPNYPNNYPNNAHCTWSLLAGELQVVSLNFTFVDLESCCDFIRVYNGPTAQHSLLGSVIGNQRATFNSSSRYMTVVFSSDVSVTPQGFRAEWAFIDYISCRDHCGYNGTLCSCTSSCQSYGNCCNDYYDYCFPTTTTTTTTTTRTTRESTMTASSLTAGGAPCGGNLTQSRGEFFSPNYPNNYPNNAHCTWSLLAGELQVVSLNFTFVDLESCCDFIRVYNGPTAQHSLLGSVIGNQRATFNSSSRYMTVVFSSDVSVTPQGFRAEWAFIGKCYLISFQLHSFCLWTVQ
ncbi:deleted in malignant brain tumors 1 protein-like isoform X3 [Ictalurus furcatus]|uniref:deleted in malignant brain tumors 1 protein-like isoform X3 n=1 Tax=Ictalurus furcatus TaxID=66913 RepID=UPI00234FEA48|nr:deleted in malignant brain tumors 1 protein-like isoform X3 [Ictalurus furcatus]